MKGILDFDATTIVYIIYCAYCIKFDEPLRLVRTCRHLTVT